MKQYRTNEIKGFFFFLHLNSTYLTLKLCLWGERKNKIGKNTDIKQIVIIILELNKIWGKREEEEEDEQEKNLQRKKMFYKLKKEKIKLNFIKRVKTCTT